MAISPLDMLILVLTWAVLALLGVILTAVGLYLFFKMATLGYLNARRHYRKEREGNE